MWAVHNIYVQMIMDELRKQQYEEAYGHLQILYPSSISANEAFQNISDPVYGNNTLRSIHKLLGTIAELCFTNKNSAGGIGGDGSAQGTYIYIDMHLAYSN